MAVNIGPRIGIEGEAEYRSELNKIIQTQKTLNSEMKATESAWDKDTSAKEKAKQKTQLLNQQIATQNKRIEMLRKGLDESAQKFGENDVKTLKWKQALADAETELNRLEKELREVPNGVQLVGQKFEEAGQKMQAAGQKIQAVGNAITNVGSTLTRTVTAPLLAAGAAAIKLGSDYEENINKVDVAFGKSARQVKDWAKTATKNFGMSESAALDATSAFGDMATSMGLSDDEAAEMAISLAGLSGDLSSFKNIDIKTAMTALKGVFTGETESLKGLGIVMTQTNLKKFAEEMGLVYDEMSEAEKVTLRYQYVMEKTANAQGDYLRTSDGFANSFRTLKAEVSNLGASFGQELLPYVTPLVQRITEIVKGFGDLDESTKQMIIRSAGLAAAIGPVLTIGGKLVTGVGKLLEGAGQVVSWIGQVIPSLGGLSGALGPVAVAFGLAVGGGAALGFALKELKEKFGWESQIGDFNQQIRATADAAREAREQVAKTTDSLKKTTENAENIMQEADAAADLTDRYAEELYDLAGKTNRTEEEQRRLEAVVASLNKIYPGFTEAVLDSNGSLKKGTEELKDYIGELKNAAKVEALKRIIDEFTDKIVEAEMAQIEAEHALEDAREASSAAGEKKAQVENELSRNAAEAERASKNHASALKQEKFDMDAANAAELERIETLGRMNSGLIDLEGETVNAAQATEQLSDSQNMASNEEKKLAASVEESEKAVADATDTRDEYQKQLDDLVDEMGDYIDSEMDAATATGETEEATSEASDTVSDYADNVEDAAEKIREANQKIRDSYDQEAKSAKDAVMEQKDLWKQLEAQESTSVEKMIAGLISHENAIRDWDRNSSGLLNSQRYQTDETFRNMVNSVIAGGEDLAPELQVIYDLWASGDEQLEELVNHYGNVDNLAEIQSQNIAKAKTAAEYGLEEMQRAFSEMFNDPAKLLSNPTKLIDAVLEGNKQFVKKGMSAFLSGGKQVGAAAGTGMSESTGEVEVGAEQVTATAEAGVEKVSDLSDDAETAGKDVGAAIAKGARAERGEIDSAFTSLRTAVSTNISIIQNLKSAAKTAGMNLATNISDGITQMTKNVTTAMNGVKASVEAGINNIAGKKSNMLSTGQALGTSLATGLTNKSTEAYNAGVSIGNQLANGVGSTEGNARNKANNVANAVRSTISAADNSDLYKWGNHMGQNFANGVASTEGAARLAAQKVANAVASVLKHSTPKEGPLKDDDVWGLHLGQNLADGMLQSIPQIESAAMEIADSIAFPTSTVMDIDAVSGRNVAETLTLDGLFDVISSAVSEQPMTVQIGNREFARILREQGAIA